MGCSYLGYRTIGLELVVLVMLRPSQANPNLNHERIHPLTILYVLSQVEQF